MRLLAVVSLCLVGLCGSAAWAAGEPAGAEENPPSLMRLPAGHPEIGAGRRPAATRPSSTGKLAIRATQGTQGGPAVAGDVVTINLMHRGQSIKKIDARLDDHGVVIVEDVPLAMPIEPLVTVQHADVEYQAMGEAMDSLHPDGQVEVKVYETTDQAPAWYVAMRHVILHRTVEGLQVTEMLAVNNPADRAWLGTADGQGGRATLVLPLPPGAQNVTIMDGFHDCCTKAVDGKLINAMAIVPGSTKYQFGYLLPTKDGQASLAVTAPAMTKHTMVFVPEDLTASAQGLQDGGVMPMEDGNMRFYKAKDVPPGQQATLSLSGLAIADAVAPPLAASNLPQIVAGVGAGLVLVVGALVMLVKAKSNPKPR